MYHTDRAPLCARDAGSNIEKKIILREDRGYWAIVLDFPAVKQEVNKLL